jgi:hypothetical protein
LESCGVVVLPLELVELVELGCGLDWLDWLVLVLVLLVVCSPGSAPAPVRPARNSRMTAKVATLPPTRTRQVGGRREGYAFRLDMRPSLVGVAVRNLRVDDS